MKTYELKLPTGESVFFKSEANSDQIEQAITFVKNGEEKSLEKLLQALRLLGFKSTPINLDAVDLFEL